jgi:phenylpropionate dioxygenase-like ring-hydroxylating dioxygenase large terminal subunit
MSVANVGPYSGPIKENYPRNQWWVAATSEEVTRDPKQRWILDYPVVLYRKQDGAVVALDDRCPHRWAPLSKGWVEGDNIVCGYHGFRYGPQGTCVKVPTQETQPSRAQVKSYPVIERAPLIWIWTGDPALCHESSPPDIPWLQNDGWRGSRGYMEIAANYMLLKENVLDLTHFGYVHRSTFKILDWNRAPSVDVENGQVEFRLDFPAGPLAPIFAEMTGFGSRPISRVNWGRYLSPALQHAGQDFTDPDPQPGARQQVSFRVLHATTPVSPTRMHYFWFFAFDLPLTQDQINRIVALTLKGFKEDDDMISAVQEMMERDPRGVDYPEVMVATDRSAVQARRLLQKQLNAEASLHSEPSPGKQLPVVEKAE